MVTFHSLHIGLTVLLFGSALAYPHLEVTQWPPLFDVPAPVHNPKSADDHFRNLHAVSFQVGYRWEKGFGRNNKLPEHEDEVHYVGFQGFHEGRYNAMRASGNASKWDDAKTVFKDAKEYASYADAYKKVFRPMST